MIVKQTVFEEIDKGLFSYAFEVHPQVNVLGWRKIHSGKDIEIKTSEGGAT